MMRNIALALILASAGIGGMTTPANAHGGNHDGMSQWEHCRAHHGWFYCVINGRAADVPAGATVAPAAAPPPPPPPPPPAPPPPPPCNTGPFRAFFDWDKAELTADIQPILDQVAAAFANCGGLQVSVIGHADTSQSDERSQELSEARAKAVADRLVELGIPADRVEHMGRGETETFVATADGVREIQNRRVDITFGPEPEF